jgi:hypothetical protein
MTRRTKPGLSSPRERRHHEPHSPLHRCPLLRRLRQRRCPDLNDPRIHYLSQRPSFCAAATFRCAADQTLFSNSCGCIDQPKAADAGSPSCPSPSDPDVQYLSTDPLRCAAIYFSCPSGQKGFSDRCGCGCIG